MRVLRLTVFVGLLLLLAGFTAHRACAQSEGTVPAAIRSMLERAETGVAGGSNPRERDALGAVYGGREFTPLWTHEGKPTPPSVALVQELRAADAYGLRPSDYAGDALASLLSKPIGDGSAETERWAGFDVELSAAVLRFLTHLHSGRVDPRAAGFELGAMRTELDLGAVLARLASTSEVSQVIASVEPQFYHYRLLKEALARYRQLAAEPGLSDLPPVTGRTIKPGESYGGAPALRRLLRALGDLPADAHDPQDAVILDPALVAALKSFQERHELDPDGAIAGATYAALTTPLAHRVRQIELTLERWRWLPAFDTPPIIVNIPQFKLFAFRSTQDRKADILQMDVIVGRTYRRTPVFAADMRYVVFRPYWDVPYSITKQEMLPQIRSNPDYLAAHHLEIVGAADDTAEPLPPSAENIEALTAGKLRLRQRPGPDSALGPIKFILPNPYDVYLHSTPARELFKKSRRAFSHGCIRVSDPVALAAHVLQGAPGDWTPAAIEAAMNASRTLRVNLARPIRVMILYGTALATEAGTVLFFDDLYGYDRKLETLLALPPLR